jgi:drug/metabolite transporter (DMT)-like permease
LNKTLLADLILLLVAFVWGTTFVAVQNAISTLPPLTFNAIRFFIASLFLLFLIFLFYREQLQATSPKMVLSGVILGIFLFAGYGFQTVGLLYTTSSKAGFITGLSVVLVPVFALILLHQKVKWPSLLGVAVATFGLYLLTLEDSAAFNLGDLLVLLCAICFALQITLTGKYAPHYPAFMLALIQIITVSLLSLMGALLFEDMTVAFRPAILFQAHVFWALVLTAVFATALAYLAQTICQRFTTPTRVALIFAMEPVFAAATAFFWADEILGITALYGCLLIFIGMILAELQPAPIRSFFVKKIASK